MPSAANVKIDKQISPAESALATDSSSNTPLRQAITIIEHKIRNLEKRKAKLESYRELQNSGKDLNADQKTAVAKFDEVVQTLEFARDLCKQFLGIAAVSEKDAKKQARKEAVAKSQTELAKIRDVLLVQDALNQMGQENVRQDFLLGRNGAATLTEGDLKLLDDLYPAVTPKHEAGNLTFTNQVQAAAEHLLAVVDGKPKEAFGGTYCQIKEVIGKIHESGYLDQVQETIYEEQQIEVAATVIEAVVDVPVDINHEALPQPNPEQIIPPIDPINIEPTIPPVQQPVEPIRIDVPPEHQIYYQQPPKPITEMLGTGSFYFLQDSELDTPPEQIPTQTFTNQSFVTTGPPPPIPMPPHFQPYPGQPQPSGNNGVDEPLPIPEQPEETHKQRGRPPRQANNNQTFYQNNNGYNRPRQNRNGPRPNNRHN